MAYADEIEKIQAGEIVYPITCEVDPSWNCNLNCFFCTDNGIVNDGKGLLDFSIFSMLIAELSVLGTKSITFTGGGEPLVNPEFNNMVELAHSKGFELGLITNGVLLNKVEHPEWFKFIRISLDSYDRDSYIRVKGMDFFNIVVENIQALTQRQVTDVGVSYIVCIENQIGIKLAQDLAGFLGVDYIQFKPMVTKGNRKNISFEGFSGEKSIVTERYNAEDHLPCQIAGLIGVVGADANVYFCCQHRGDKHFVLGNLEKSTFKEIWKNRINLFPKVSFCKVCRYQNYARGFAKFSKPKFKFLRHTNFL